MRLLQNGIDWSLYFCSDAVWICIIFEFDQDYYNMYLEHQH